MNKMALRPLLPAGVEYIELKQQENRGTRLSMLNGILTQNYKGSSCGIMARSYASGVWGLASSAQQESMRQVVSKSISNAQILAKHSKARKLVLPANPAQGEHLLYCKNALVPTADKIDFLKALDAYIVSKYPGLSSRQVGLVSDETEKHIITSDGGELHLMIPHYTMGIWLMVNDDGAPVSSSDGFGGFGYFEDSSMQPEDYFEHVDRIYQEVMDKKEAVYARGGSFECVLDSKLAGILSHEAIGHTTEADFVINGSIAGENLNQMVADPSVTLIDVAHTWNGITCPVPVFIDDEGTVAEDCTIIEKGMLKSFMHNKESAALLGHKLTGNARAYAYLDEPIIRMRNTMIVPGKDKLKDMIASIEDGYYLVASNNGQADATSEFMFGIALGYEVKNGKIGKAIKDTTMSGVAFDLLKTVTMVSDDMYWAAGGMCGKKQRIQVGMGGPALKCRVNLGGR